MVVPAPPSSQLQQWQPETEGHAYRLAVKAVVQFGDENTNFFQAIATERFRRNNIASFRNDAGETIDDHNEKEALLFQTYTD